MKKEHEAEERAEAGFREIEHTADWELEAWAPGLTGLLEQCARGMYTLAGMRLKAGPRQSRRLEIQAQDAESLLVKFLSELLYYGSQEGLAFDRFGLSVEEYHLQAELEGAPLESLDKEIKAVTYHNLAIRKAKHSLQVRIVFDV